MYRRPEAGPRPRKKATLCRILQLEHRTRRRRRWLLQTIADPSQSAPATRPGPRPTITINLN